MPDEHDSPVLLPWIDLETTGLDAEKDFILEIGMSLTDADLRIIDSKRFVIGFNTEYGFDSRHERMERIVRVSNARLYPITNDPSDVLVSKMHEASGLWDVVMGSKWSIGEAINELDTWLHSYVTDTGRKLLPICGSSVLFDRKMIAAVDQDFDESFHYRSIDVSSIKETVRRFAPSYYSGLDQLFTTQKAHRTLEDLEDSVKEYSYYVNLIMCGDQAIVEAGQK